jgi:hypothetical protein
MATENNDILLGDGGDNEIHGLGGDDVINGLGGNDRLFGDAGNDVLTGGDGTDTLTGGTGVDTFQDTAAGLNGDTIQDFNIGDRIRITDLTKDTANIAIDGTNGNLLTYNGGSVDIANLGPGRLVIRAVEGGGVEIRLQQDAHNDFNGDGRSDVLLRNIDGTVTDWLANDRGGFTPNAANALFGVPLDWHVIGTGDFNGDGRVDLLWHNNDGTVTDWFGQTDGNFVGNPSYLNPGSSWHVQDPAAHDSIV